jgi:regulator of protease activity HflC (stomatin/prohibitin superfamily)
MDFIHFFQIIIPYISLLVIPFFFIIMLFSKGIVLVRQAEAMIIERFGRFHTILNPGIHIIIPFMDVPRSFSWTYVQETEGKRYYRYTQTSNRIDLRETVYDFPRQSVITKDNVTMEINALIYYQIIDPRAAIYEVYNLSEAIEKLTQTTLRNVVGSMELDETLVSRDFINEKLRIILDEATDKWGVKINRVELQEVNPPADIRHAMEKQMRAERERREMILRSEGQKSSAILEAEGDRESQVLRAKGDAESRVLRATGEAEARLKMAEAESQALRLIQESSPHSDPMPYLLALQYVQALPKMTEGKDNKMIIVPYEASSLVGSLASIKKMFTEIDK